MDRSEEGPFTLARVAFDLWQAGELEQAAALYGRVVPLLPEGHYRTSCVHGEYASVLASLGRFDEALVQYERELELELRDDSSRSGPGVSIARYFIGETLLELGRPEAALAAIAPVTAHEDPRYSRLGHLVAAQVYRALGRLQEARQEANLALYHAQTDEQREAVRQRLSDLLGHQP